jgi:hypothetical protein
MQKIFLENHFLIYTELLSTAGVDDKLIQLCLCLTHITELDAKYRTVEIIILCYC